MNKGLYSAKTDEWATPQYLFDELDEEFNFTLDPCASDKNHKCEKYYTKEQDGLAQKWDGVVFCNPPFEVGEYEPYEAPKGSKCPWICAEDEYYTMMPPDDFFCAYGEVKDEI